MSPAPRAKAALLAAVLLALAACAAYADTVTLKDGTQLDGIVVIEMPSKVVLKQPGGNRIIMRSDIDSITKSARVEPERTEPAAPAPQYNVITPVVRNGVAASPQEAAANAVVKVYTTVSAPDPIKPWARLPPREETGSGVVIEGRHILTSAHFLYFASQIQVKANQADGKITASVEAIAPLLDLALLKLDDPSFFDSHPPLRRSSALPRSRDVVSTFGYPADSTNVTIIRASVTEVDFAGYSFPISGVRVRTNNEYGSGMSGSPTMMGDNMVGIAVHRSGSQSVSSYVVPNEEIDPFVEGTRTGGYRGKPVIADEYQKLENPGLREFLNLDKSVHGVVVGGPNGSDANYPLRRWDVITKIAGAPVDDLGTIPFGENGRVSFTYQTQHSSVPGGTVGITVLRNGREIGVSLPVETNRPMLVPYREGKYPSYFIIGPIAFASATTEIYNLTSRAEQLDSILAYRGSPLVTRRMDRPAFDGEELVYVPSPFFPHKLAKGYGDPTFSTVKSVNGTPVRNLAHLVELVRDSADEFLVIEFAEKDSEILVFPRAAMIAATDDILGDNGVRSQGSPDMMAVWNAKSAR